MERLGGASAIKAAARPACSAPSSRRPSIQKPMRKKHLRLRGLGCVPCGKQRVACLGQPLGIAPSRFPDGSGPAEEKLGPFGIVLRPEPKGGVVETFGSLDRVERRGPVARIAQRLPGRLAERRRVEPGGLGQLERLKVVVGEHLGLILGASERLDPGGRLSMLVRACSARDLAVCDVADE